MDCAPPINGNPINDASITKAQANDFIQILFITETPNVEMQVKPSLLNVTTARFGIPTRWVSLTGSFSPNDEATRPGAGVKDD